MSKIKEIIIKLSGEKTTNYIVKKKRIRRLARNFKEDFKLYKRDSTLFSMDTYDKLVCEITLNYHSIEKGFLYTPPRLRFAKDRVHNLIHLLDKIDLSLHNKETQIQSAIVCLCNYYDYHVSQGVDISEYFPKEEYSLYLSHIKHLGLQSHKSYQKEAYFSLMRQDFKTISEYRHSIRQYTGEMIDHSTINKVIAMANTAPSVCNRQSSKCYLVENAELIQQVLEIQGGLTGYTKELHQIIVLTVDRNYFYSIGERYQPYIDGGIYLMNLLYALNYYGIAACPAHWAKTVKEEVIAQRILGLKQSEKIICIIAIGKPTEEFNVTLSLKKSPEENLSFIK